MFQDESIQKKKTAWTIEVALTEMQRYCAIQDRSHKEVRTKLIEHQVYGDAVEDIIADLISNGFLDEERFARSYARGKFRMNDWGKNKIIQELKMKGVSAYSIKASMEEIPDDEYLATLHTLLEKKSQHASFKNTFERMKKLTDYALSKGYEYEVIRSVLQKE
jgi:regulatory protein